MYDAEDLGEILGMDLEEPLPDDLAAAFRARARPRRVAKDKVIIQQGTYATEVFLIDKGTVGFHIASPNGRDTSLRTMGAGRLFGELAALTDKGRSVSAFAVEGCDVSVMSGPAFVAYINEVPGAGYWMSRQLASRVRHLTEKVSELATLPVATRIHWELRRLAEASKEGDRAVIADFPIHAEFAARIGSHREAVTRELSQLEQEGIISRPKSSPGGPKHSLVIVSLARLQALIDRMSR